MAPQFQVSFLTHDGTRRKLVTPQEDAQSARDRVLALHDGAEILGVKLIDPANQGRDHD